MTFCISPLEIQIAYKLWLGSEKDIEDALFLLEVSRERINMDLLREFLPHLEYRMIPPDNSFREKNKQERIWFVKKSADWIRSVSNEVWNRQQCQFINSQFRNRESYPLSKQQYLQMIETARTLSSRRDGSPRMPDCTRTFRK